MKSLSTLSAIIEYYDALLLDLWGVIHDGTHLYPGVPEVLSQLKSANKKIIFVSNAPRRAHKAQAVLTQLGIAQELYSEVITSGEMGYRWLAAGNASFGKRYYYIGPAKDADILDGLDFVRTDDVKQVDFLLNVGFGSESYESAECLPLLRAAHALALPMLCLNPDLEVVKITGERFACAGVIAQDYQRLGGEVIWFGKPYGAIYDYCFEKLAPIGKPRILAIGDSLTTDIAGAQKAGVDSVLVSSGILKHSEKPLDMLCREAGVTPNYVMPQLMW